MANSIKLISNFIIFASCFFVFSYTIVEGTELPPRKPSSETFEFRPDFIIAEFLEKNFSGVVEFFSPVLTDVEFVAEPTTKKQGKYAEKWVSNDSFDELLHYAAFFAVSVFVVGLYICLITGPIICVMYLIGWIYYFYYKFCVVQRLGFAGGAFWPKPARPFKRT